MRNLTQLLEEYLALQKERILCTFLQKGLEADELHAVIENNLHYNHKIDPLIIELYNWRNGTDLNFAYNIASNYLETWLIDFGTFLSIEDAIKNGNPLAFDLDDLNIREKGDVLSIFFTLTGVDHYIFLHDYERIGYSPVWIKDSPLYLVGTGDEPVQTIQKYDSIYTLFETFNIALTRGVLQVSGQNFELDYIEFYKIGLENNPQSDYWKYNKILY